MQDELARKLSILADAAKYDASCASGNAGKRAAEKGGKGIGSLTGGTGICHSFTPDGRCISLLKILMTNYCIYDCQYCINRISSNVPRARFKEQEVIDLTLNFYRRNYIEGLFLSSGIIQSPDYTMSALIRIVKSLRQDHDFRGYIHLKTIPNASPALQEEAGWYADRLSINVELPTQQSLNVYAPEKNLCEITGTMNRLNEKISETLEERKNKLRFTPGGQSTQMIVGADSTSDKGILTTSVGLYSKYKLRRVYYSAFSPIPDASTILPARPAPLLREHRLYQADWLLRFYEFQLNDIVAGTKDDMLDLNLDPKLAWALRNRHLFPVDLNRAERHLLLKVPGLGVRSVDKIIQIRRYHQLSWFDLMKLRVTLDKVRPFVSVADYAPKSSLLEHVQLQDLLVKPRQLNLFQAV